MQKIRFQRSDIICDITAPSKRSTNRQSQEKVEFIGELTNASKNASRLAEIFELKISCVFHFDFE